jgi:hypothetical protein
VSRNLQLAATGQNPASTNTRWRHGDPLCINGSRRSDILVTLWNSVVSDDRPMNGCNNHMPLAPGRRLMAGWIRRADSGRYQARYRIPGGRTRSRTFERRRDADRWLRHEVARLDRGDWIDPDAGTVTVAEWSDRWMATRLHIRDSTRERDETYLRSLVLPTSVPGGSVTSPVTTYRTGSQNSPRKATQQPRSSSPTGWCRWRSTPRSTTPLSNAHPARA